MIIILIILAVSCYMFFSDKWLLFHPQFLKMTMHKYIKSYKLHRLPFEYSVTVRNRGKSDIKVDAFYIGKRSLVGVGPAAGQECLLIFVNLKAV